MNGEVFHSKAEMIYYRDIVVPMLTTGMIADAVRQPRLLLGEPQEQKDTKRLYIPDFLIVGNGRADSGQSYYVDVKGYEPPEFAEVKRCWRRCGRLDLMIVELKGKVFKTREIIPAALEPLT